MDKIKVSLISYLNSRPFLYGLTHSPLRDEIEIHLDIPAVTAVKLAAHQTDIGLIPVGALPDLEEYRLVSNFCIGAEGAVRTTVLASQVPLEEITTVVLDYQSRSSVLLTRVLAQFFWKKAFQWRDSHAGFENELISGTTAGVVIGDRVFSVEKKYPYLTDLSLEWMKFCGMPFVFAVWAATNPIPEPFLERFNNAIALGIENIPEVEKTEQSRYPDIDIYDYFTKNISYTLNDQKRSGMALFLELAQQVTGNRITGTENSAALQRKKQ